MHGTIRRLVHDRGYGFITGADRQSYFLHASELDSTTWALLVEGDRVEFEVMESPRGPRASAVRRV